MPRNTYGRVLLAALVLVVTGVLLLAWPRSDTVTYEGSYVLIRNAAEPFPPMTLAVVSWDRLQVVGAVLTVAGALLGAYALATRPGRRRE